MSCTATPRAGQLPFGQRLVELGPGHLRARAQAVVPRPEVDARGGRLVGIAIRRGPLAPAPGPDRRAADLAADLLDREHLHLIVSNQALAGLRRSRPPWPGFVWKPRKIPIFDRGMPIEVRSVTPWRKAFRSVRDPSTGPCRRSAGGEVDLAYEVRVERHLAPPVAGLAVREGAAVQEQERMRAEGVQAAHELEHVVAVLRVRRRPGRREVRAEHLVERDPRRRAGRRRDRPVEDAVGPVLDDVRLERVTRSPDALAEVHLPVDRLLPEGPHLRREDEVRRRSHDAGRANIVQYGTDPSAKSTQTGALFGSPHSRACAWPGRGREQRSRSRRRRRAAASRRAKASCPRERGSHYVLV